MIYTIYKPNKNNNGGLATFRVKKQKNEKDGWTSTLFIELLKQNSWNSETHTGTFDKESRKFIALNVSEAGEFLNTFKNNQAFSAFHKSAKGSTSFSLVPYQWNRKIGDKQENIMCYGLSASSNNVQYKIPITPGEAQALSLLLEHFIKEHAALQLKQEEALRKESFNKKTLTEESPVVESDIPF